MANDHNHASARYNRHFAIGAALTVHLVVTDEARNDALLRDIQQHLQDAFGIEHSTIQIESATADTECMLDRPRCVQAAQACAWRGPGRQPRQVR